MSSLTSFFLFILIISSEVWCRRQKKPEPDMELVMHWKDLSLKTICEEEEWRAQFEPVKDKFARCLGLKKLVMDDSDPEGDADRFSMFRSENNNPYCRISKTWDSCTHFLKGLNCIEPNAEEITRGSAHGFSGMLDDHKHYDPEDMNSMVRPYKMQCEMAKFAASYGMDYYGGMGMDYGEGEDGVPHAEGDF